jgi:hypothetical protein
MKSHKGTEDYESSLTSFLSKRRKTVDQQAEAPFNKFDPGHNQMFPSIARSSRSSKSSTKPSTKSTKSSKSSTKSFKSSTKSFAKSSAQSSEKLNESTDIVSESEKHDDFVPTKVNQKMAFFGFKIDFFFCFESYGFGNKGKSNISLI